jgi:hypothetical protein
MKRALLASVALVPFLSTLASVAGAYVIIRPLSEADLGDTSHWPAGLEKVAKRYKCVTGQELIAPSWGRGTISAQLCFAGDADAFKAFLKEYANVKHDALSLTLHPGKGAFRGAGKKEKKAVPFDWQLSVALNGLFESPDAKQEIKLGVSYYVGDCTDLTALDIPPGIQVKPGYDEAYRKAHRDDAAVKAIDALVRAIQERKPSQ